MLLGWPIKQQRQAQDCSFPLAIACLLIFSKRHGKKSTKVTDFTPKGSVC